MSEIGALWLHSLLRLFVHYFFDKVAILYKKNFDRLIFS